MDAWNGWYHVNGHTYGSWLPGDRRGWRDKKHRTHCEGDYKHPPAPGTGDELLERSKSLLKHPPVKLSPPQREVAGRAIVESLSDFQLEPLSFSLDALHYHILLRVRDRRVRHHVGQAKLNARYRLRDRWDVHEVWQRLCDVTPINDRDHQLRVFDYIQEHSNVGAWTWTFRQGLYWRVPPSQTPPGPIPGVPPLLPHPILSLRAPTPLAIHRDPCISRRSRYIPSYPGNQGDHG